MDRRTLAIAIFGAVAIGAAGFAMVRHYRRRPALTQAEFDARYTAPLAAPVQGVGVYHLGHSLVGRVMPDMLQQLAHAAGLTDHHFASQLGWGATLSQHRQGPAAVPGFDTENAHAAHRLADEAMASGQYDAVVLTEMVELRDAIKYHDSGRNLAYWARAARAGNPDARVYLYESWHRLDDAAGWLNRLDGDLARHWEGDLLRPAMALPETGTIFVIPAGQAMAAVARAAEAGSLPGLTRREDLFAREADGQTDPIHFSDLGAYVVALTHFAVIYHRSPVGLPFALRHPDGTQAAAFSETAARAVQSLVWQVVTGYAPTGVAGKWR